MSPRKENIRFWYRKHVGTVWGGDAAERPHPIFRYGLESTVVLYTVEHDRVTINPPTTASLSARHAFNAIRISECHLGNKTFAFGTEDT